MGGDLVIFPSNEKICCPKNLLGQWDWLFFYTKFLQKSLILWINFLHGSLESWLKLKEQVLVTDDFWSYLLLSLKIKLLLKKNQNIIFASIGRHEWWKCQPQSHIYTLYILIYFLLLIIICALFSGFGYQVKERKKKKKKKLLQISFCLSFHKF